MSEQHSLAGPSTASQGGGGRDPQYENVKVYRAPADTDSPLATSTLLALGDEDLKPTADELKRAFKSTIAGRHGPDAPLLTKAMREKEEERLGLYSSRHRKWDNVRIRIRFSDRTQIESSFAESDTIQAIYTFLEQSLDEQTRAEPVIIYSTPPRVEYRRDDPKIAAKSLRELGLIPSAVLNLRWQNPDRNGKLTFSSSLCLYRIDASSIDTHRLAIPFLS
jgi:tether containing UBX domain for GLUT4